MEERMNIAKPQVPNKPEIVKKPNFIFRKTKPKKGLGPDDKRNAGKHDRP